MSPAKPSGDVRSQSANPTDGSNSSKAAAPKAWTTGTNPITQRTSGSPAPNGLANGHGQSHQEQGKVGARESQTPEKHAHDRLMFLLSNFIGLDGILTLQTGEQFFGVFSGATLQNGDARYLMKMVRKTGASPQSGETLQHESLVGEGEDFAMAFDVNDTADLSVAGVTFGPTQSRAANGSAFKTDTEISGNLDSRERVLQRWQPGPDDKTDLSLASEGSFGQGQWDQFAANEKLFYLKTDYNEDLYTTTIDKTNPRYKQTAARAERLAREIEGNANRTATQADSGLDEEDKYSGVRRTEPALVKGGSNAYVPPSKRAITNQPTVHGAPFDPAIISSQLAKPDAGLSTQPGARPNASTVESQGPDNGNTAESASDKIKDSVSKVLSGSNATPNNGQAKSAASQNSSVTTQTSVPSVDTSPDMMKNLTDAFRQFKQNETLRVQSVQRESQARRVNQARQEKSVKLNDLRKFSQNFKLNSRVPEDLVPILAKSKEKQDEIIKRADQQVREQEEQNVVGTSSPPKSAKTDSTHATVQRTVTPSEASVETAPQIGGRTRSQQQTGRGQGVSTQIPRAPSQANQRNPLPVRGGSAAAGSTTVIIPRSVAPVAQAETSVLSPTSASSIRFNAKAMEFKPNPSASTFTPTAPSTENSSAKRPSIVSPPPASGRPTPSAEFFTAASQRSKLADGDWDTVTSKCFSPAIRLLKQSQEDESKKAQYASNGGIPQGYRTAPVWGHPEANAEKSFVDFFTKVPNLASPSVHASQNGSMPHQHQLPLHLQNGGPHVHQQSQFYRGQAHSMTPHHMEDQRMHFASAASSVQPSPRMGQQAMVFNGQGPPQMAGYPYMASAGMSPAMAMRTLPAGAQYMNGQGSPMGGHMMVQQPSNGPYGHMGQQQVQMYPSPNPSHVQPHFGGHAGQPGMPGGYGGSPRAHPMSHQGSQQGHTPQQMFMMPGQMVMMPHHGGPTPMRGYSQGQFVGQHPQNQYAMQHRALSNGGYSQHVTPRQQHAMPHQQPMLGTPNPPAASNGEDGR